MLLIIKEYHSNNIKQIADLFSVENTVLLFIGEAVFYLLENIEIHKAKIVALKDSVQLFGLAEKIPAHIPLIDYPEWVKLTEEYAKIITL